MAVAADRIEYLEREAFIPPPPDISPDAVRYVAGLGDFIEPRDKSQLRNIGARSGGLRIGDSDTEGAPTLWRTKYIIRRGAFTPLETTSVLAKGDEYTSDLLKPKPITERMRYPAADILLLQDDEHLNQGIVEISALRGRPWADGSAKALNRHFFPKFADWLNGEDFPKYLRIYEEMVREARIETDDHATTQTELLESARKFRVYALNQIEVNRARIQATRNVDMGGFSISWTGRARLFAEQLEIQLENEKDVAPAPQERADPQVLDEQKRANDLKERELVLKERELAVLEGRAAPVVETVETCSAVTGKGERCQHTAVKDGRCGLPAHRLLETGPIDLADIEV